MPYALDREDLSLEADDEFAVEADDEASAEFLPGLLGRVLPGVGGAVGSLLGASPRSPLPRTGGGPQGSGVGTATINTPRGSATLQLPENVVPVSEYRATVQRLEGAINRNTERLNTTQKDILGLGQRVAAVVNSTRQDIAKAQAEQRQALVRLRRNQRSQSTNNMFISLIMQQQIQRQLTSHTHQVTAANQPTGPALNVDGDNTMMMMLPMMMMGDGGGGQGDDSNMMMMMAMMMAMR